MKYLFSILLVSSISIGCYSQNRICFIDSLEICKDEIAKMEEFNWMKIRNNPIIQSYPEIIQFHFFVLKNLSDTKITINEFLDYSFLKKLSFIRIKRNISRFRKISLLLANTYLFTPDGKPVGELDSYGRLLPPDWLCVDNINDLGHLVAEKKISFAFGGTRDIPYGKYVFDGGFGDYYCVIQDTIYLIENFHIFDQSDNNGLHLTPLKELINQNVQLFHSKQNKTRTMIKWTSKDSIESITFTNSQLKRMFNPKNVQMDDSNSTGGYTYKSNQFYIRWSRPDDSIKDLWIVRVYKHKRNWHLIAEGEVHKPDSNPFTKIDYLNKKIIFSTYNGVIGELNLDDL